MAALSTSSSSIKKQVSQKIHLHHIILLQPQQATGCAHAHADFEQAGSVEEAERLANGHVGIVLAEDGDGVIALEKHSKAATVSHFFKQLPGDVDGRSRNGQRR